MKPACIFHRQQGSRLASERLASIANVAKATPKSSLKLSLNSEIRHGVDNLDEPNSLSLLGQPDLHKLSVSRRLDATLSVS